jgi:16S rRNA (guanine(966)-N(2))-methyltransferase RsmD
MLRILGGEFRSRVLHSPVDDRVTRPFSSRAKESLCNILRGWFEDANVLDLFAGVGTMGLEAVSRGAANVLMVEKNPATYALLRKNVEALGCEDRASTMKADALGNTCLLRAPQPVDLVFCDPPYILMHEEASRLRVLEQLERCRTIMNPKGFLTLRIDVDPKVIPHTLAGFHGPEVHEFGRGTMRVMLYQPMSEDEFDDVSENVSDTDSADAMSGKPGSDVWT